MKKTENVSLIVCLSHKPLNESRSLLLPKNIYIYIYIYPYMHTHLHIHIDLFRFAIKGVITIFVVAVDVFHG